MKQEVNPKDTNRAEAFKFWMSSPMPMVTLVKTINVSRLVRLCKRKCMSFNMMLCWCIGKAASEVREFYTIPEQGKLYNYDSLAINVIVNNAKGGINSCDIPFCNDIRQFSEEYLRQTRLVAASCQSSFVEDRMVIGTSAMIQTELDCIVNQYTDKFCNPMLMWGKLRNSWFKITLPISFQFHHVQMDGGHGAMFLEKLQQTINSL